MQRKVLSLLVTSVVVSSVMAQQPTKRSPFASPFAPIPAGPPIQFEPFPMVDPSTGKPVTPDTVLVLPDGTKVTAREFYAGLNALEKSLNALGYSFKRTRTIHVPSRQMYDPEALKQQDAAFSSMVYPDGAPTPGPEEGDFNPAGGFDVPWTWDSGWLGNWYIGAKASIQTGLSGDIAPVNFRAHAEGSLWTRFWGREQEVARAVAEAKLEPTSATNLQLRVFAEAYINGERRWSWPANGPFTRDIPTGVSGEYTGSQALQIWNYSDARPFEFSVWVLRISGRLGASGSLKLEYFYRAGLNAVNNSPAIEAGVTPRGQLSGFAEARVEANVWVASLWGGVNANINILTWRMPVSVGAQVGQANGRYYADRYIRARSEATDILRGRVDWYAGARFLWWSWSTSGVLFDWQGFSHNGTLIDWNHRHYF